MRNHKIRVANTFLTKGIGLMGNTTLRVDEGLLLVNCNAIHTFFMMYPLTVIFWMIDLP